jgi:hypothetical protein
MITNDESAGKSSGISERRSEGIAGHSREVSKRDERMPLPDEARQENEELEWAKRHIREEPVPQQVERKTEIIGCGVRVKRSKPVPPGADDFRKCFRSIMNLQDRMRENLFLQLNILRHRIEAIEDQVAVLRKQGRR